MKVYALNFRAIVPLTVMKGKTRRIFVASKGSEDRVHNFATDRSPGTKDCSISQLLAKLLSHFLTLARPLVDGVIGHLHWRYITVVRVAWARGWRRTLLILPLCWVSAIVYLLVTAIARLAK